MIFLDIINYISLFLGEVLKYFYNLTGNYAYSIILFAVAIKIALLYFTNQQYKSMKDMQLIQPEMKKLQERYKGDPEKLNQKVMELWKTHGVNPLSGCFPLLVQMPIIYALYRTIDQFKVEFTSAKFLWIGSMADSMIPRADIPFLGKDIPLLGSSLAAPDLILAVIYGISMYLTQMLTVAPTPQNAGQQKITAIAMSIFITFVMCKFQSALILYWLVFNALSIVQQQLLFKFYDDKKLKDNVITEENTDSNLEEEEEVVSVGNSTQELEAKKTVKLDTKKKKKRK